MALTQVDLTNIVANTLPVANGGTGVTTSTGTGAGVHAISPTFTGTVVAPTINAGASSALTLQSAGTTALTIDTGGYTYINTSNLYNNCRLSVAFNGATGNALGCQNTDTGSATQNAIFFYRNGTQVATISYSNTTVFYNTSSDYRLKENVAPMTGALAKVTQLKPVTYNWKVDGSNGQGFIAHELKAIVPECVTGEKDEVDAEGNPVHQGVDTSFLVATLTAAIQELKAEFDAYKATHP